MLPSVSQITIFLVSVCVSRKTQFPVFFRSRRIPRHDTRNTRCLATGAAPPQLSETQSNAPPAPTTPHVFLLPVHSTPHVFDWSGHKHERVCLRGRHTVLRTQQPANTTPTHTHTHTPRSQRRHVRSTPRHPARKEILGCWCHATQCNAVRCVHAEARLFPFAESVVVVVVAAAGCLLGGGSFFQELRNVLVFFLPGKIEGRFAVVVLDV